MPKLRYTALFRRDFRKGVARGCDPEKLRSLLELLRRGAPLPLNSRDGPMKNAEARACRVEPGWLLVYRIRKDVVTLMRVKYIKKERPTGAPPIKLWFKTLLRSPVKTVLTVLLLAAAAFLLLDNLSSYAMQSEAIREAEAKVEGVLTVEREPVSQPQGATSAWYLLTDPTNPGETHSPKVSYEALHHEALTAADLEALESLPYIDAVDARYMTAGVSGEYTRHEGPLENYSYTDRLVLEATVTAVRELEDYMSFWATDGAFSITLADVTLLAGEGAYLEAQQKALNGQARLTALTIPAENVGSLPGCALSISKGGGSGSAVECLDYDLTREKVQSLQAGRRYVFAVRAAVGGANDSLTFYLGDDSLKGWQPYFTDVTDLPENYLETEDFASLRALIQITNDDLHTFDVVYTDDMASIRRVARHQLTASSGRFLTPGDAGDPVCVVSEDFLQRNGLKLGDRVTLRLGNYLMEQYAPLGAVAVTRGRYATQWAEESFTIVGTWKDASDRHWQEQEHYSVYSTGSWQDQDPYWAYSDNAIFVPASFLPAGCDTASHAFRPGEVSFLVREASNIGAFTEEGLPQVEALGLRYAWNDAGWPAVAEKLGETKALAGVKLLVFTLAALLAAALTVYLFLLRRRQEYAVLRALGTPRKAAAKALWLPLMALAAFAAALGLGAAWLHSGAAAARSAAEFAEAGLEVLPEAHMAVYLLGALGLLAAVALLSALCLLILGKRSPLMLMQDVRRRRGKKAGQPDSETELSGYAGAAAAQVLPLTFAGKPNRGFLGRYILRHARRAGVKTLLTLLLAALLVGAVGQLTVLRERYGELLARVRVEAGFYDGLSLHRAETLVESGLVRDPVYLTSFREGELEMDPAEVVFTNRLDSVVSDPVTWLDGWDEEKAMGERGRICILTASEMEKYGIQLGDEVRVNEFGCIDYLQFGHDVRVETWEEALALRDRYRPFYTVVGRVETAQEKAVVYAPVTAFGSYSFFGTTLYLDSATFVLCDWRDAGKLRQLAEEIRYTAKKPPNFVMDTSDADRIYRVYRLIETLYPLTVAAALILGTLLPVLMILQEQKEAAILRALGWSKKLTIRRLTLEQAALCLAGLALALLALFAVNGLGFLGVILVPLVYVAAHFALCVAASAAISASILQKSPMRLLQAKE